MPTGSHRGCFFRVASERDSRIGVDCCEHSLQASRRKDWVPDVKEKGAVKSAVRVAASTQKTAEVVEREQLVWISEDSGLLVATVR